MNKQLDLVKFNLTEEMTKQLIEFNKLKKELITLKEKENLNIEETIKLKELDDRLNKSRLNFIKEFRRNNKEEIEEYLKIKDQN
jgi:hypothetical protein